MAIWWCSFPGGAWQSVTTIDEFGGGFNDDCGPCANENAQACLEGRAPTYPHMDAIRANDLAHGHFTVGGGQTISDIDWDLHNWSQLDHTVLSPFNAAGYSIAQVRAALNNLAGGYGALIVEISHAAALPNNEPNVNYHFVAVLGYDEIGANLGGQGAVFVANGDREPLPKGIGKPDWYSLPALMAAGVCGMVEIHAVRPTPPPAPPDIADAEAAIAAAEKELADAQSLLHA